MPPRSHAELDPHSRFGLSGPRLWAGLVTTAVLGGLAALGLGLLVGALHPGAHVSTIVKTTPATAAPPSTAWSTAYRRANAGVVNITVEVATTVLTPFGSQPQTQTGIGSGFVLDTRGDILTAAHVIDGATAIHVRFADGATRRANLVGKDDGADVAVIRAASAGLDLRPLRLGSSAALRVGDALAVIGDPLGFQRSLSTGVVSGLDRTIQAPNGFEIAHAIQTDAAMNPGNSGGPLVDPSGRVIGLADQIAVGTDEFGNQASTQTYTGVGFAVPVDLIRAELPALEQGRSVRHAYLGVASADAVNGTAGALVTSVQSGSPAARAGLRAGDVIMAFNATRITSGGSLIDALAAARPDQIVKLTISRGSSRIVRSVTLGNQPAKAPS